MCDKSVAFAIVGAFLITYFGMLFHGCAITPGELDLKQELHVKP